MKNETVIDCFKTGIVNVVNINPQELMEKLGLLCYRGFGSVEKRANLNFV